MDTREERGRRLAQDGLVQHCAGPMWFVASQTAGGYLVNVETGTCSCPDAQRGKCKHRFAVDFAQAALPAPDGAPAPQKPPPGLPALPRGLRGDLTAQEQAHVKTALRCLRVRYGGWEPLAKAIRFKPKTLTSGLPASPRLVFRLARVAGVPVDDLLTGRFPPPGTFCPHCGRELPRQEVDHAETV